MDFVEFHRRDLPARIEAGNGALAYDDVAPLGAVALRLRDTGASFTYVASEGKIELVAGDEAARSVVELDQESFDGLVADLESVPGLLYSGRLTTERGSPMRLLEWEPGLRALYHGVPIIDVHHPPPLTDLDGGRLDPSASFTLDDLRAAPDAAAHFLRTAGYIVVRGVFRPDEVEAMLAATHVLEAEAIDGDKGSWWAKTSEGHQILCRVLEAAHLPAFSTVASDPRLAEVVALSDRELEANDRLGNESVTVLWKRHDITEGLADLPWHRDCGMGGHAHICPRIVVTICLTEGNAAAGELRVIPGSHQGSFHFIDGTDPNAPTGVSLETGPGDVSFHYSDLAHASMPPTSATGPHRISALVDFGPTDLTTHHGEGRYNDALFDADDGQVEHLRDKFT